MRGRAPCGSTTAQGQVPSSLTHLLGKLGGFDLHKGSSHCLQVAALVVEGDTARPWNKSHHNVRLAQCLHQELQEAKEELLPAPALPWSCSATGREADLQEDCTPGTTALPASLGTNNSPSGS